MNSYGNLFKVTLYGESHQDAIGVVVDGMIPGTEIDLDLIKQDLDRRKPGAVGTTPRKEADEFRITSGVFNGKATGSPIHLMIENHNMKSKDYEKLVHQPRPGHADFVANVKYNGFHDYRGGGRFSGRLTAPLVAAGSLAKMILPFQFSSEMVRVGTLTDLSHLDEYLLEVAKAGDSVGGIVKVVVKDVPIGLGEPFFHKLDAEIAKMVMSVPAVRGVSFGAGFEAADKLGSAWNDAFINDRGITKTNHSGGVSGGISNGNDLIIKVLVKPTSSIQKKQHTFDFSKNEVSDLEIGGRHDVAIIRRIGVVLENVIAIVLADMMLQSKAWKSN